ncbi:MAG: bifunctional diaminohydroxyphosphoribosylaminopyrimidine deaminase/5-amino-6-(5-phosphoribosylamino)uracil reductase RibD [Sedimentisphaerales bacterium]|nr:bifunctional diaminohydroxyphosphoribosylaminopyrimidine deaminase/5-amino-6-(5-phosphoribosylamino)uracil reductase RibD [Sedimentisphaerales bacterium]
MTGDEKYMQVALKLARRGIGSVEPNPAVGCVIVKDNKIIGKGWHKKFGGPHAEINALKNCKKSPAGATMYVTLEPCCHFGKTPPCTDAIIEAGIKKVVAATKDPTEKVNGKGFKILKKAGFEIKTGICKKEAEKLNAPFFKFTRTKRPWVIIKWAQSQDGFLARTDKKRWISNQKSRKDVHKLRKRAQAILVGINTVLEDDPMLTARPDTGRQPLRAVLDSRLKIPLNCNLIKTAKKTPAIVFTTQKSTGKTALLRKKGAETIKVQAVAGKCSIKAVLDELAERDVQQLLVEGGEKTITAFLKQKLADEIIVYTSNEKLSKNGNIKTSQIMKRTYNHLEKNYSYKKLFGKDVRLTGFIK